jgi:hypothetical protein
MSEDSRTKRDDVDELLRAHWQGPPPPNDLARARVFAAVQAEAHQDAARGPKGESRGEGGAAVARGVEGGAPSARSEVRQGAVASDGRFARRARWLSVAAGLAAAAAVAMVLAPARDAGTLGPGLGPTGTLGASPGAAPSTEELALGEALGLVPSPLSAAQLLVDDEEESDWD